MELSVTDLSVARGGVALLSGVSFRLASGEALVLRGPNGVGKTTLLRTVAGLQPPLAGRIEADRDQIAYAGHADAVKATLSVAENLGFWAAIYGTGGIGPALEAMALRDFAGRPAQSLSAGQKRRLGLARLMVSGRGLWLLDEPTVSLDAASVGLFAAMVGAHLARGGAALVATHVDLGLTGARDLDLTARRAVRAALPASAAGFNEAFL
jgi:heme exporter protein A